MLNLKDLEGLNLRVGQMRANDFVHNGGWYSKTGEKLGWGDLSPKDFQNLMGNLPSGELLFVLGEQDSYWKFVSFSDSKERVEVKVNSEERHPGIEYLFKKARWVLCKEKCYKIVNDTYYGSREFGEVAGNGFNYTLISEEDFEAIYRTL